MRNWVGISSSVSKTVPHFFKKIQAQVRWGERITPIGFSDIDLPPCTKTGLEMVREHMARPRAGGPF
jgi:hypothetical protein